MTLPLTTHLVAGAAPTPDAASTRLETTQRKGEILSIVVPMRTTEVAM